MPTAQSLRPVALALSLCFALGAVGVRAAHAADAEATLTLKDHKFEPEQLKVPAGQRLKLTVINHDKTPEEFESKPLKIEKVVPGNGRITLFIGPLKPGSYKFVGEYHEDSTKGVLIVE
jgi:plastocyanin